MKKNLITLALVGIMLASATTSTVYTTKYGKKYHTSKSCLSLAKSKADNITETSIANAEKEGKTLCKMCENRDKKNNNNK